jgi:hypothetical protein
MQQHTKLNHTTYQCTVQLLCMHMRAQQKQQQQQQQFTAAGRNTNTA